METIKFDDFAKIDLRIARIVSAEKIEGADKLLKLIVSLGEEERQIVAGIAQHYSPEELVGKKIVLVANLEPKKLRGVESQGMLLAAVKGNDEEIALLIPDKDIREGTKVS
ncbi:MAG: methionine--tRNA ligase subunit beta [Candidatus Aenigmarchaeota archaeon]|nr:methionine--tRNA ligase subunit beta [Candidatus Aenigmarchaeota archaeon]